MTQRIEIPRIGTGAFGLGVAWLPAFLRLLSLALRLSRP